MTFFECLYYVQEFSLCYIINYYINYFNSTSTKRQIVPKNDTLATAVQQLTNQQPANVIVPQGIQHVLINGQLYPIIQTANGTHLLIQQPVGQVQQAGKQVFTAQPIQLGSLQQVPTKPATASQPVPYLPQGQQSVASAAVASSTSNVGQQALSGQASTSDTQQQGVLNSAAPPLNSSSYSTSATNNASLTATTLPPNTFSPSTHKSSSTATTYQPRHPVPVDARTQQLLTRIQNQIDAFKSKPSLDADARTTLQQLQEAQQRVLNNVRNQKATTAGTHQPARPSNGVMTGTNAQQPQFLHPSPQFLRQEVLQQSSAKEKKLIIKPSK